MPLAPGWCMIKGVDSDEFMLDGQEGGRMLFVRIEWMFNKMGHEDSLLHLKS
jgi:hypothetical protein